MVIAVLLAGVVFAAPTNQGPDFCFSGVSSVSFSNLNLTARVALTRNVVSHFVEFCLSASPDRAPPQKQTLHSI
jgi:hypothetical protein